MSGLVAFILIEDADGSAKDSNAVDVARNVTDGLARCESRVLSLPRCQP